MVKAAINYTCYYFILISLCIASPGATGQNSSAMFSRVITIKKATIRIDSLLDNFTKQANAGFSFNSKTINPGRKIPVKKHRQTLLEWLSALEENIGIHYTLVGDHIILTDIPPVKQKNDLPKKPVKPGPKNKAAIKTTSTRGVPDSSNDSIVKLESNNVPLYLQVRNAIDTVFVQRQQPVAAILYQNVPLISNYTLTPLVYLAQHTRILPIKNSTAMRKKATLFTKNGAPKELNKVTVELGISVSMPGSLSKVDSASPVGIGLDIKLEKSFSKRFAGTLSVGYNYFIGEYTYYNYTGTSSGYITANNFANLPILAGLKYYIDNRFYVSGEAGMAIKGSRNTGTHAAVSPSAGYHFSFARKQFEAGIKFMYVKSGFGILESSRLQNGGYSLWSFRIGYVF